MIFVALFDMQSRAAQMYSMPPTDRPTDLGADPDAQVRKDECGRSDGPFQARFFARFRKVVWETAKGNALTVPAQKVGLR